MNLLRKLAAIAAAIVLTTQLAFAAPQTVNVNSADAETLAAVLDGVGISRARAIVEYRETHGRFLDLYDLANVKGIGDRTIELNEGRIRVDD